MFVFHLSHPKLEILINAGTNCTFRGMKFAQLEMSGSFSHLMFFVSNDHILRGRSIGPTLPLQLRPSQ